MENMKIYNALVAAKLAGASGGGGSNISSANVTSMTGYAKAETAADISTSDTLNVAMGKLEKSISDNAANKQDKLLTGYVAVVTPSASETITATDSVVEGFEKLDNNIRLNASNVSIEDITTSYVIEEGYALKTGLSKVYKQGKHVFGKLVVAKSSGTLPTSQTKILTNATYKPPVSYVTGCFCGTTEWKVNNIGYVYMSPTTGELSIYDSDDSNSDTVVNISLDYVMT